MEMQAKRMCGLFLALIFSMVTLTPVWAQSPKSNPNGADTKWATTQRVSAGFDSDIEDFDGIRIIRSAQVYLSTNEVWLPSGAIENAYNNLYIEVMYVYFGDPFEYYYLQGGTSDFVFNINTHDLSQARVTATVKLEDQFGVPFTADVNITWEGTGTLTTALTRIREGEINSRELSKDRDAQATGTIFIEELPEADNMIPDPSSYGDLAYTETHALVK